MLKEKELTSMGNIGSQVGNISQKYRLETESQRSLPRNLHQNDNVQNQQQKVLPSRDFTQKLRSTENGEILQAGGTLTGRHQPKVSRGNFMNAKNKSNYIKDLNETGVNNHKEQMKKFGSEPDLRNYTPHEKFIKKNKKYKAPPRPSNRHDDSEKHSTEIQNWEIQNEAATKRVGLFKTRVETRKKVSSTINNNYNYSLSPTITIRNKQNIIGETNENRRSLPELQRRRPSLDFTEELKEVTQRVHNARLDIKQMPHEGKLEKTTHQEKIETRHPQVKTTNNVKKFYFGMTASKGSDYVNYNIQNQSTLPVILPDSSNLDDSCNSDEDCGNTTRGISLRLRPILPKKLPEIPKFSPGAAWKLLFSTDSRSNECSTNHNDDESALIEETIEKISHSPPPLFKLIDLRLSQDKSGDSGISGDETPKAILHNYRNEKSWTPQQDLGDDSSAEEEIKSNSIPFIITNKPHIFSLSLPRDNLATHLAERNGKSPTLQSYRGLQKLKRSMSGVFGNIGIKIDDNLNTCKARNSNWFLSKSAPNSLNNGFSSLETYQKQEESLSLLVPISNQQSKGRIMYLPQSFNNKIAKQTKYENVEEKHCIEPQDMQDPPNLLTSNYKHLKPKRFTFQNTIRQIERRRLAEKLASEVEKKEQQRLREVEAMQRIEEEFQRKRSRYDPLYTKNQPDVRKILLTVGEKSV